MQLFHFSATVAVATAAATALFAATVNAASNNNPFWFQIFIQNMPPSSGVNSTQIPAFQALNGNSSIIVSWETNTCAPAQNQVSPCNFGSGNKPKPSDIFPKGFDGFGVMSATNSNFSLDLSKDSNNGTFLENGKNPGMYWISNLARLPSDYYFIYLHAQDSFGNVIQGQSVVFAVQNTGPLPTLAPVKIVAPLQGAVWVPNNDYLIEWQFFGLTVYPDTFSIDMVDPTNGSKIANVYSHSRALYINPQSGNNASNWRIPAQFSNMRVKLVWTCTFPGQSLLSNISAESGVFQIAATNSNSAITGSFSFSSSPLVSLLTLLVFSAVYLL